MNLLFVCTRNMARSPMAEAICRELAAEAARGTGGRGPRYEVRSAGTGAGAVRRLTTRDLAWADVVAVMEEAHLEHIRRFWPEQVKKVRVLGVPDDYDPEDPELREVLAGKIRALLADLA